MHRILCCKKADDRTLDIAGWAIVGLFAAEYAVHLALAEDRARFIRNPWRILDAAIVLAPVVSLLALSLQAVYAEPAHLQKGLIHQSQFGSLSRSRPAAALT